MSNISRIIKTILQLKDEMSPNLKKNSEATKRLSEKVKKSRDQVKKFQIANTKATAGLKEQKDKIKALTTIQNKNNKALDTSKSQINKYKDLTRRATNQIERYQNQTGLSSKQIAKNNNKIVQARKKINGYRLAQMKANISIRKNNESLSKVKTSMENANSSIKKYSESIKSNNKNISHANQKITEYTKKIKKNISTQKEAQSAVNRWGKGAIKSIDKVIARSVKLGLVTAGVVAALGAKMGFSEAMDMEGYKMQLETAVKDTEKAGKLMSKAVDFADRTPFETGDIVEATATMEMYGLSSTRWLSDIADMAGSTNKQIGDATEAMVDSSVGEFERLKQFGISKDMIMTASAKKYGDKIVFNAKGQMLDQVKMQTVLQELMQEKFKGGAEKQARTMKGLLSTVTGSIKSSLKQIVGIQKDGTIKQGSMYEKVKEQIKGVTNTLLKWKQDGTITRIASNVTEAVMKIMEIIKKLFNFFMKYKWVIELALVFVGVIYTTVKAFKALQAIVMVVNVVTGLLNGTLMVSPLGAIAITIGVVVGALYLLWTHMDSIIAVFKSTWDWIKNLISGTSDFALMLAGPIAPLLLLIKHFDDIKEAARKAFGWVKKIFGIDNKDKEFNVTMNKKENSKIDFQNSNPGKNMEQYAEGGIATKPSIFGEAGAEIAIPLNQSKRSKDLLGQANNIIGGSNPGKVVNNYKMIFTGDVYGFEDFKEILAKGLYEIIKENNQNVVV